MTTRILFILIITCFLGTGCNLINPKEDIPTYVHIDSFTFTSANPGLTGTSRQDINSVFAYLDGDPLGVYELPADIPVLMDGTKELQLAPAVNEQGMKDFKLAYPLFAFYNTNITADPGKTITIHPETKYIDDLKFWRTDFESGNTFQKLSGDTAVRLVSGVDSVFEGGKAGCIALNVAGGLNNAESFSLIDFIPGQNAYLEIHYKGNLPFAVGILAALNNGSNTYSYLAGIKPKDEWGKFYVNIAQYTSKYPSALNFSVIIRAALEDGQTDGYILLDNIKVISY